MYLGSLPEYIEMVLRVKHGEKYSKNPKLSLELSPWEGFLLLNIKVSRPVLLTPHVLPATSHSASMLTMHGFMSTVSVGLLSLCLLLWAFLPTLYGDLKHFFQNAPLELNNTGQKSLSGPQIHPSLKR